MSTKHPITANTSFQLEAPPELMLPAFSGELQGYDPGEKEGWRCAFITYFEVADGERRVKSIAPRQWRINGGGFDLRDLPDEYLLAALEDVSHRGLRDLSTSARQIIQNPFSGWQDRARQILQRVLGIEQPRISRHNPPYRTAILGGVPDDVRDRIRD